MYPRRKYTHHFVPCESLADKCTLLSFLRAITALCTAESVEPSVMCVSAPSTHNNSSISLFFWKGKTNISENVVYSVDIIRVQVKRIEVARVLHNRDNENTELIIYNYTCNARDKRVFVC